MPADICTASQKATSNAKRTKKGALRAGTLHGRCMHAPPQSLPVDRDPMRAGPLGFYKGMRTKIVQSILAAALLMAIKEEISSASHVILAKSAAVLPAALPVAAAPTPSQVVSDTPADI